MTKVRVPLHFGKGFVEVEVPEENVMAILEPKDLPAVPDDGAEVRRALRKPIAAPTLASAAKPGKTVAIISDDYTRVTPVRTLLPPILEELSEAGVSDEDIKIIIALGTHRAMNRKEMEEKLGTDIVEKFNVLNHAWKDVETLVNLGKTELGTPVLVNGHVVKADIKVGLGNIIPHRVAGYSGGAKVVQPGVCGGETTDQTHWLSAKYKTEDILGVAENPVRLEIEAVARKVGLTMVVNTVLNRAERVVKVLAGDAIMAHRAGVAEAERVFRVELAKPADIVVCDSHPADVDMWQANKGITAAGLAVKPGGTIVYITPCSEGISSEHPAVEKLGYMPYRKIKEIVEKGEVEDLSAAAHIAHVGRIIIDKAPCILVSEGISRSEAYHVGFDYAETPQEALDKAFERHGPRAKVAVMRNTPELLPIIAKAG